MYFARGWHSKSLPPLKNSVLRKEREKRLEQDRENLASVKAHVDTAVPVTYVQRKKFKAKDKKMRGEKYHPSMSNERVRQIEKHNKCLVNRMVEIFTAEPEYKVNPTVQHMLSSYSSNRKRELRRINHENKILLKRLEHQKTAPGMYSVKKWNKESDERMKILKHMCVYPYQILDDWNQRKQEEKQRLLQYPELQDLTPLAAAAYALSLPGEPPIPKQRSAPALTGAHPQKRLPPLPTTGAQQRSGPAPAAPKRTRHQEWALVTLREDWSAGSKQLSITNGLDRVTSGEGESVDGAGAAKSVYSGKHTLSSHAVQVEVRRAPRSTPQQTSAFVTQTVKSVQSISGPHCHGMRFPTKEALTEHLIDDLADIETHTWELQITASNEQEGISATLALPGSFIEVAFQGFPSLLAEHYAGELAKFVVPFLSLAQRPAHAGKARKEGAAPGPAAWELFVELGPVSQLGLELEIERRLAALNNSSSDAKRKLVIESTTFCDLPASAPAATTLPEPHSARSYHEPRAEAADREQDTLSDI